MTKNNQTELALIPHTYQGHLVQQRSGDGYVNATALCLVANKRFFDYHRLGNTAEFLEELASETGIPVSELVQTLKGGLHPALQGTWVHPHVAIHLAQWLSASFAVRVSQWVYDWMSGLGPEHRAWQIFQERISLVYDNVPDGYWCIFKETSDLYATMISNGAPLGARMILDISIGIHWGSHWKENGLSASYGGRRTFQHYYPLSFSQSRSNPQSSSCYPDEALASFRRWMREEYIPHKLPDYLKGLVQRKALQPSAANDTLLALEFNRKNRVRVKRED